MPAPENDSCGNFVESENLKFIMYANLQTHPEVGTGLVVQAALDSSTQRFMKNACKNLLPVIRPPLPCWKTCFVKESLNFYIGRWFILFLWDSRSWSSEQAVQCGLREKILQTGRFPKLFAAWIIFTSHTNAQLWAPELAAPKSTRRSKRI